MRGGDGGEQGEHQTKVEQAVHADVIQLMQVRGAAQTGDQQAVTVWNTTHEVRGLAEKSVPQDSKDWLGRTT